MLDTTPQLKDGPIEVLVVGSPRTFPSKATRCLVMLRDNWDDYGYKTTFVAHLFDDDSVSYEIGSLSIGKAKQELGYVDIDNGIIDYLDESYFSLGSKSYYENLKLLPKSCREHIYSVLRDMAFNQVIWAEYKNENVTQTSLLRSASVRTVEEQYRRIAHGGVILTPYRFRYQLPKFEDSIDTPTLDFEVDPEDRLPPNNIHVIIGRNGVGKSYTISRMLHAASTPNQRVVDKNGLFSYGEEDSLFSRETASFQKVISISFSAFDKFENTPDDTEDTKFLRIGLNNILEGERDTNMAVSLSEQFGKVALECITPGKIRLWKNAIETLHSDQLLRDYGFIGLDQAIEDVFHGGNDAQERFIQHCQYLFDNLSSGHKIVIIAVASLIKHLEEKTLVLIDEPETHLHPPLLSAFIRTLSDLLEQQNGVAIIATHSPLVLLEVPRKCVWKLSRTDEGMKAERPRRETFGENVSVLTDEVFKLQVDDSGFHQILKQQAEKHDSYTAALNQFEGQLGSEAKAILRGFFANKR